VHLPANGFPGELTLHELEPTPTHLPALTFAQTDKVPDALGDTLNIGPDPERSTRCKALGQVALRRHQNGQQMSPRFKDSHRQPFAQRRKHKRGSVTQGSVFLPAKPWAKDVNSRNAFTLDDPTNLSLVPALVPADDYQIPAVLSSCTRTRDGCPRSHEIDEVLLWVEPPKV
jgi:hypothetical protein